MKKLFRVFNVMTAVLFVCMTLGCASKKGELQEINDEDFAPKLILIASGTERLIKFEFNDKELVPGVDTKAIKAATLEVSIYSGRKPAEGGKDGNAVTTVSFDLIKDADKLLKGYDLMAHAKELKTSADDLNSKLSANQYYYAKGNFEVTVKESKTVTKTKTIYSNDTVYTPVDKDSVTGSGVVDAK